jgi:hypothetical protein
MKLYYTNPHLGIRLDDQNAEYSFADVARFLSEFTHAGISLITTMPCGLGLDFHLEEGGIIWIEFYGDEIQSTFVDLLTAKKILERAYHLQSCHSVRQSFSDLVQKWEY